MAVERAKRGESKIYAISVGEYSQARVYEIEDYDALLYALGESTSDHRHHILWEYSKYDRGEPTARIKMTFKCGCILTRDTMRTLHRELKEQHKIEIVLRTVPTDNNTDTVEVGVRRCDIKDKPTELK